MMTPLVQRCLAGLLLAGLCGLARAQVPLVVTTTPILADFVREVAGDAVQVESIVPPGVSPRDYEPGEAAVARLARAQALVIQGLDYDAWSEGVAREAGFAGELIVATDRMPLLDLSGREYEMDEGTEIDGEGFDPNTWHDPRKVVHTARVLAVALADLRPTEAAAIEQRAAAFIRALEDVHQHALRRFATLPPERRRMATSLDGFAYLAATYEVQIGLIPGFEPGRQPQPAQMARLIDLIEPLNVPAVFLAAGTSATALRELQEATGVRVITTLFTDTLGPPGSPDGSYLAQFRRNVDLIVDALK